MGLFDLFKSKPKEVDGIPPEVAKIFDKLHRFLTDEAQQNAQLPVQLRVVIEGGASVDEVPHGIGLFGLSPTNPIPVNGPMGELTYLSNLATAAGQRVVFHRLGSVKDIDVFEVMSFNGSDWALLYFSLYHPRKSKKAPPGFQLLSAKQYEPFIFGINQFAKSFPYDIESHISKCTARLLGMPLRPPRFRQRYASDAKRPAEQSEKIAVMQRSAFQAAGAET
jgi:hypothetical protein